MNRDWEPFPLPGNHREPSLPRSKAPCLRVRRVRRQASRYVDADVVLDGLRRKLDAAREQMAKPRK